MQPAHQPPRRRDAVRALLVNPDGRAVEIARPRLLDQLGPGDLLVFNDASTLPAALPLLAPTLAAHQVFEARLTGPPQGRRVQVVTFGPGTWREDTDLRRPPPPFPVGTTLRLAGLDAHVQEVSPLSQRLLTLEVRATLSALYEAIYAKGKPVQYAHLADPLALWSVQTIWASRPWAVEMPSAAASFTWAEIAGLRNRGIEVATLTHAAGLSATGDPRLDDALPLPERFAVPDATATAVRRIRSAGGRVVAVGTSVARALETAVQQCGGLQSLHGISGVATLRLGPAHTLMAVDGLVTGMHVPGESHFELLGALVPPPTLRRMGEEAQARGFASHEFGDVALVWRAPATQSTDGVTPISFRRRSAPSTASMTQSMYRAST